VYQGVPKVNIVKYRSFVEITSQAMIVPVLLMSVLSLLCVAGCSDEVRLPSAEQLVDFEKAGPVLPTVDVDRLIRAQVGGVPLTGEVLEITMPTILHVLTVEEPDGARELAPYVCRVSERGTIVLPVVGEIQIGEKNLAEIEAAIVDAYYPKYAATHPSVFVRLVERVEQPLFTVLGLVNKPGNFPYPPEARYNVMQAIGSAGGLDQNGEPRYATIYRLRSDGTIAHASFEIANIKGGSGLTDALSVLVKPGDIVAVEHTLRTRANRFLERIFKVNFGAYIPVWR